MGEGVVTKSRLRILHFTYDHPDNPWCGGGGAQRTWAINRILSRDHDVTVVCGAFPGMSFSSEPFHIQFLGHATNYLESRLKYILKSACFNMRPYDLVVEDFSVYAPVFLPAKGRCRITILNSHYGLAALKYTGGFGLFSILGEYALLRARKHFIVVSKHLKRIVPGNADVSVIGQGVDLPARQPLRSEDYVLFLGRFDVKVKGIDILLKAWSYIPPQKRILPLHMVGGGDFRSVKRMKDSLNLDDVKIVGRVDHESVFSAIARAAFICIPSRSEGFGLVAAETMALGKPLVVSAIPSLKSLVSHGIAGLQVPPGDPALLSKAIERLLLDKALRFQLSRGASEMGKKFSWEKIAKEQEAFYWKAIHTQRERRRRS
jgi:glycosyltransferase involved in cell wall biosynthesis